MILVGGATGNVGRSVVTGLAERGRAVRAVSRHASGSSWPTGVEPFDADLGQDAIPSGLLDGIDALFAMPGYAGSDRLMTEATGNGIGRIVLLSANSAVLGDTENVVARYHVLSEWAAQASGVEWTILRPVSFMVNTLQWVDQLAAGDTVAEPFADVPVAVIDPQDIAAVAVSCLVEPGHDGAIYRLTGPEALLPADRARRLGAALGRDIVLHAQSDDEAREALSARMEPPFIDAFFDFFRSGRYDEAAVTHAVPTITGRPARTFDEWAEANAGAFR